MSSYKPKRVLSVFSLVMINIIAVDSIRTLPMAASYGFSLITLYIIAALAFFIPTALITAELATTWPEKGGMYTWVKVAFGPRWGLCVVYLQWIYNVVWYPTILTFIASTLAYLISPKLVENSTFMVAIVLVTFWSCTIINCFGMSISSAVSTCGSIFGTLIPMLLIISLCGFWLYNGNAPEINLGLKALNPSLDTFAELVFFSQIVYSLLGLEMSSVHALEVKDPAKDYPRALLISAIIILASLSLASLAMAIVVPEASLDNLTGMIQAFNLFASEFNIPWLAPLVACTIIIGGICAVATWIIGPTKGLFAAASDNLLPNFLSKTNRYSVPHTMLICQGIVCSVLTLVYLFLPTVEEAYFALSALAAQLSMLMYALLFAAAITLRYKQPDKKRPYKIPGGNWGIWCVGGVGLLLSLFIVGLGYVPPITKLKITNVYLYEGFLILGSIVILLPIFLIHTNGKQKKPNLSNSHSPTP